MKFKKVLAAVLAASTLLTTCVPANATNVTEATANTPAPCYELLGSAVVTLSFNGDTAFCESTVDARTSVRKITVVQKLQKYWGLWIWNDVDGAEWTKTEDAFDLVIVESFDGVDSGKYRVELEITLEDSSGATETVTAYSREVDVTV